VQSKYFFLKLQNFYEIIFIDYQYFAKTSIPICRKERSDLSNYKGMQSVPICRKTLLDSVIPNLSKNAPNLSKASRTCRKLMDARPELVEKKSPICRK